MMFRSQSTRTGEETGVGTGWRIAGDAQNRRYGHHEGSMEAPAPLYYPEQKLAVAILSNLSILSNIPRDIESLAIALAESFLPDA